MSTFHPLRVIEVGPEAQDALSIALEVPEALRDVYGFEAGQHLVLRANVDGEELRRTYSLANAPGEWPLRLSVRVHDQGRFSRFLARELRPGVEVDALPAAGSFTARPLRPGQRSFVAFVAGSGMAPVLSIVRATLASQPESRFHVFYGNRATGRVMLLEELLALKNRWLERLALHFVMSREPQEIEIYNGRIDGARARALVAAFLDPDDISDAFLCGPGTMIEEISGALRGLGLDAARIHAERFTLADAHAIAQPHTLVGRAEPAAAGSAATEVTVTLDGRRRGFSMQPYETLLEAGLGAGLELPFSCQAGVCGTCRTRLLNGRVDMEQNHALEPQEVEAGYILACQSRPLTATVEIDYDEK